VPVPIPPARLRNLSAGVLAVAVLAALAFGAAPSSAKTVWLCKPGMKPDPCAPGLSTTVYNPPLTQPVGVRHPKAVKHPPVDCFYVYPTVSDEKSGNSDRKIENTETSIALYQASRYSQYCRVFAPMYRQVTLAGAGLPGTSGSTSKADPALGPKDVTNALKDYLKHFNHGRGIVFIGHSQGSAVLREVIAKQIDPHPALRKRLLSAILMGGNVLVKGHSGIGGDFKHIPACRRNTQLGCVIAFSTFDQPPPSDTFFGKPTPILGTKVKKGTTVLCTNPANLRGGSGKLIPISPSAPFAPGSTIALGLGVLNFKQPTPSTVYWTAPGAYSARCVNSNGANVLEIAAHNGAQTPTPAPTPEWGLHLLDANIALGNLVSIVHSESKAFVRRR
jgi:Protein of unknown function (DUF3089)